MMVIRAAPFPRNVTKDHRPRPDGSSPLFTIRDTQLSQITVAVPPGWYLDKNSSVALEVW